MGKLLRCKLLFSGHQYMEKDLLLALDVGTQSIRAILFDDQGHAIKTGQTALNSYHHPKPGWVEQTAEYFWKNLAATTQQLWAGEPQLASRVRATALTTQRSTVFNLDKQGRALRPGIIWMDQRTASAKEPLPLHWRLAFSAARETATIRYLRQQCQINWIYENQRDIWEQTDRYLFLSGLLNRRLTGEDADSVANQVGYIPFDFKKQTWASNASWKWDAVKVRPDMLPKLVPVGDTIGDITTDAAESTGIPVGTPVIASAGDKVCEVLGAGCLDAHTACMSFGTQATISCFSPRYFEAIPMLPAFPAAVPGFYCPEVTVIRGFWMVSWFKEQFAAFEAMQAEETGLPVEHTLDKLAAQIPPGSLGLTLQPFWGGGIRYPGLSAKGAVVGFGGVHTRSHFYRAILEGLAYALRDGRERIEKRGRLNIASLRVSGGGAKSDVAMQIAADVHNLPAERPHTTETSALGAAINAAVASKMYSSYTDAVAAMCRVSERIDPIPENAQIYAALYQKVYQKMYPKLAPLYDAIREITGYPS